MPRANPRELSIAEFSNHIQQRIDPLEKKRKKLSDIEELLSPRSLRPKLAKFKIKQHPIYVLVDISGKTVTPVRTHIEISPAQVRRLLEHQDVEGKLNFYSEKTGRRLKMKEPGEIESYLENENLFAKLRLNFHDEDEGDEEESDSDSETGEDDLTPWLNARKKKVGIDLAFDKDSEETYEQQLTSHVNALIRLLGYMR